jgi:PhoPQ-activated pathogenicity-related protein
MIFIALDFREVPRMRKILIAIVLAASATACTPTKLPVSVNPCSNQGFENTVACYVATAENQPLKYTLIAHEQLPGVTKRVYRMTSQFWSPQQLVEPSEWQHDVTIYMPEHALHGRALLVANNGTPHPLDGGSPIPPNDFPAEALATIAKGTNTVVVSMDYVPSQYLTYTDDGKARREDDSVAHSWALFMKEPEQRRAMSVHVPMAASISRAMTLAQREMAGLDIHHFIVSGISKRAWVSWLDVTADPRIDAVVPFASDLLNTRDMMKLMYRSYGNNWPIAFYPYYAENIDKHIDTQAFTWLMQIEDPLQYLGTPYSSRLTIPKYMVNASGDDFYTPDSSQLYFEKLPGAPSDKVLRTVPNSSHSGIRNATIDSLTTFVNRIQHGISLPVIRSSLEGSGENHAISFLPSEYPQKVLLWHAENPHARDFRYACGIRYESTPIPLHTARVPIALPESGWNAYFIEATFADGFVATTPVYILGKKEYPDAAPPSNGDACQTLPGRGFQP